MSAEKSLSSYSGSAKSTPDRLCSSTSGIEPVIRVDAGIAGRSLVMLNFASWVAARIAGGNGVVARGTGVDGRDGAACGPRKPSAS